MFRSIYAVQESISRCTIYVTRWYPRGIQKLVSTYDLPDSGPMGGGGKVGAGRYSGVRTENIQSAKICLNFNFLGGGGLSDLKFQRGALWRIWTQILLFVVTVHKPPCASQIVSHILRMWRLMKTQFFTEKCATFETILFMKHNCLESIC